MAAQNIPGIDQELKKAFQDLQIKMIQTRQQIKVSDMQKEQLKRQIVHSNLVEQELTTLPDDTKTYEGVGRMFILTPMTQVKDNLVEKKKSADEKISNIDSHKIYLEKNIKESEDNIREMVLSKQMARS
ncbi:prefoldin subunit 1-like [Lineus longissimus]|uniref:prefoldin subunit 1-like n=1 Tax=Lineus longissimus TaxID=88925 RepID=UPI002B4F2B8A